MKKIICWLKGHKRGLTAHRGKRWFIACERCNHVISYLSPHARLVGTEIRFGFDGN